MLAHTVSTAVRNTAYLKEEERICKHALESEYRRNKVHVAILFPDTATRMPSNG